MFRFVRLVDLMIVPFIALNYWIAFVDDVPLTFNPLFFACTHQQTKDFSVFAWWYILIPAHTIEMLIGLYFAVMQGESVLNCLLFSIQTFVFGYPGIAAVRRAGRARANKKK